MGPQHQGLEEIVNSAGVGQLADGWKRMCSALALWWSSLLWVQRVSGWLLALVQEGPQWGQGKPDSPSGARVIVSKDCNSWDVYRAQGPCEWVQPDGTGRRGGGRVVKGPSHPRGRIVRAPGTAHWCLTGRWARATPWDSRNPDGFLCRTSWFENVTNSFNFSDTV